MGESVEPGEQLDYVGEELELFEVARNWKEYFASRLRPYIAGSVLEVGAGLGANASYLYHDGVRRYLALEPDPKLCEKYRLRQESGKIPASCELKRGTIQSLSSESFDSIVYIDVLEHIENDRAELARAYERLHPGGHLCVLCPAHNLLFSPMDAAIGHFRRYNKAMFRALLESSPIRLEYLDSVGMAASLANRLLLRQSYPSPAQVMLWDRLFVPTSRILDVMLFRSFGKSIVGVWKK